MPNWMDCEGCRKKNERIAELETKDKEIAALFCKTLTKKFDWCRSALADCLKTLGGDPYAIPDDCGLDWHVWLCNQLKARIAALAEGGGAPCPGGPWINGGEDEHGPIDLCQRCHQGREMHEEGGSDAGNNPRKA